jgi:Flp pilus assembly protein TadG
MKRNRQAGITTVEFAIVGLLVFAMIFGVIEVARGYFTYAMLDDVARRGARLAAVCPINDPAVPQMAIYNASGDAGTSPLVAGLTPGHVVVDYLDDTGSVVGTPADPAVFTQIRFVRARVVGFEHTFVVPLVSSVASITMPEFQTILPRESLGIPRDGAVTPC